MGYRLSKIYTKTGDDGTTGLGNGERIAKNSLRIESLGAIDELNSSLGIVRACLTAPYMPNGLELWQLQLRQIQHELFDLGGELSIPDFMLLTEHDSARLEQEIDTMNALLPPLKNFILPAGSMAIAQTHMARTICRRAERALIALILQDSPVNRLSLQYVNRLSDWLFVFARTIALHEKGQEELWLQHRKPKA